MAALPGVLAIQFSSPLFEPPVSGHELYGSIIRPKAIDRIERMVHGFGAGTSASKGGPAASGGPGPHRREKLAAEIRAALKAGEKTRLGALRLLSAAVKNREVELRRPLSEEEFAEVVTREAKRRTEAIQAYQAAGRDDRAALELEERGVLEAYLPPPLSDHEVDALIEEGVASTGAAGSRDLGKVMSYVMARAKGRVDGRVVQQRVARRLGQ